MKRTIPIPRAWVVSALLAAVVAVACVPRVARRQTDVMEKSGSITVSAAVLRAGVNSLADRFADQIEATADEIRASTKDREVRRRALAFKVDAVPAVYTAAYRSDPLAAVADMWALAFQVNQYVDEGAGQAAFGPAQGIARESARALVAEADRVVRGATRPGEFDRARADVQRWVAAHPVRHSFSARPSIGALAAELRSESRDAFVAVGEVSETIESLSERLNTYAAQLPKLARWQAELLVAEQTGEHDVESVLDDVSALGAAARRTNALLDDVPALASEGGSTLREAVAAERQALLKGVNGQRVETLAYLTAERLAVAAALREERIATVAALRQERIESLKEIDAIKSRAVDSAVAGLRGIVDFALWRFAILLLLLLAAAAVLATLTYHLTIGRRPPAAP